MTAEVAEHPELVHFWDFNVWGGFFLVALLLIGLLVANILKKRIPFLEKSLIPTSVLAGVILLLVATIYKWITGSSLFDAAVFGGGSVNVNGETIAFNGYQKLQIITYHALALGFIASSLKTSDKKMTKKRSKEVFNTGVTTVATYLIQAIVGLGICLIAVNLIVGFNNPEVGLLLPFGYGQGPGQALNYGMIYEQGLLDENGVALGTGIAGGSDFGSTIAALGFLSAAIGGVIHLNILRRKGKIKSTNKSENMGVVDAVEGENEIPMQDSIDKMTIQIAFIAVAYALSFAMMYLLGELLPSMKSTIYGFNFLLGVLAALLVKVVLKFLKKKGIVKKHYVNNFLMTRASNLFYDIMVVASLAAIRLEALQDYWHIILILGVVGLVVTYAYNYFVARMLFKDYAEEQFMAMYGMLTGTASTGIILLREIDGDFKTPVADNLVYQNLPAIAFGFPMMLLASDFVMRQPLIVFGILIAFFAVMNLILFRAQIFKRKKQIEPLDKAA